MGSEKGGDSEHDRAAALKEAGRAASAGDPLGMLSALHRSRYLDGLVRRLGATWQYLSQDDVYDCVARAVDQTYVKVAAGDQVIALPGLLYRIASRRCSDLNRDQARRRHSEVDELPEPDGMLDVLSAPANPGPDPDALRREALKRAREMVPLLGEANIQMVATYLLDAVEARREVSDEDIASATGLTKNTAGRLRRRVFERLEKRAREAGLWEVDLEDALADPEAEMEESE